MENITKINLELFSSDFSDREISAEYKKAYEVLAALPERASELSVKTFCTELRQRWSDLFTILGKETKDFSGYSLDDVNVIEDFFKTEIFNGMQAVKVQKILRNIWMQCPCRDKRLNYDFYDFIDKKFYAIVNNAKSSVSFEHIPAPDQSTWEVLQKDWQTRRAYYAQELKIDIEYLDGEAVDGTIFPSASGLFANPVPPDENSESALLEFLNFWMPHLCHKSSSEIETSLNILQSISVFVILQEISTKSNIKWICQKEYWPFNLRQRIDFVEKKGEILNEIRNKILDCLIPKLDKLAETTDFSLDPHASWNMSKEIIFNHFKEYYKNLQPTSFMVKIPISTSLGKNWVQPFFDFDNFEEWQKKSGNEFYCQDILPKFINSCQEYALQTDYIQKTNDLILHGRKKVYSLDGCLQDILTKYEKMLCAIEQALPAWKNEDSNEAKGAVLDRYYNDVYKKLTPFIYVDKIRNSHWHEVMQNITLAKKEKFRTVLKDFFDFILQDNSLASPHDKLQLLITIKDHFYEALDSTWEYIFYERIEHFRKKYNLPDTDTFSLSEKMQFFSLRNDYLREQEKHQMQLKEIETRENVFFEMSHSIKNLVATVIDPLLSLKKQLEGSQLGTIERALAGTGLIRALAQGIHYSMRGEIGAWRKDIVAPGEQSTTLEQIIKDAICYAVPNMFDGKYFQTFLYNYFQRDRNLFKEAQKEWAKVDSLTSAVDCIQRYFFAFNLNFTGNLATPIGDSDGTATKLLILFQELFLNAVKYASFTPRENRFVNFSTDVSENKWIFILENSADEQKRAKKSGLGLKIIKNFATLFEAEYQVHREDDVYRTMLIFDTKKEA